MLEVISNSDGRNGSSPSSSASTTPSSFKAKPGRKYKFTASEDLIIAQEVAPAEAHVAPHGTTVSRFEKAALKANQNPNFAHKVIGKNKQDRFKKLLNDYALRDGRDHNISGTGGEIGELDQLLGDLLEAKKDHESKEQGDANGKLQQEQKKLAAGAELILQSLKGKERKHKESGDGGQVPSKKRRVDLTDGMQEFSTVLKQSEQSRFEFEREKLEREMEAKREDRAERALEREQRKDEVNSYRQTMDRIIQENGKQMQALMGLVGSFLQKEKEGKE